MGDLWHPDVDYAFRLAMFVTMARNSRHTFLCLTKRPERIDVHLQYGWPPNVWLGVSAETQQRYDERVFKLMQIPAPVRFVSLEPMLEVIKLRQVASEHVDWVIVGGESGPAARVFSELWVADLIHQCRKLEIPLFVKQLGSCWARKVPSARSRNGSDPAEWDSWMRVRQVPKRRWDACDREGGI